jgi:hypothetical protein
MTAGAGATGKTALTERRYKPEIILCHRFSQMKKRWSHETFNLAIYLSGTLLTD